MKNKIFVITVAIIVFFALIFLPINTMEQKEDTDASLNYDVSLQESEKVAEKAPETPEPLNKKTAQKKGDSLLENENKTTPSPEPLKVNEDDKKTLTCSLSIRCDDVINNLELLDENKRSIIPEDGIILSLSSINFNEGESVFDLLIRELKKAHIHFEFEKTPMYNSAYIKGIGNLCEFDCGDCSGWLYKVNGVVPMCGCSQYEIKSNDEIEFVYTCNYLEKI